MLPRMSVVGSDDIAPISTALCPLWEPKKPSFSPNGGILTAMLLYLGDTYIVQNVILYNKIF